MEAISHLYRWSPRGEQQIEQVSGSLSAVKRWGKLYMLDKIYVMKVAAGWRLDIKYFNTLESTTIFKGETGFQDLLNFLQKWRAAKSDGGIEYYFNGEYVGQDKGSLVAKWFAY